MPAGRKERIFEGVGIGVLILLLVLAALKVSGFTGFSLRIMLAGMMAVMAAVVVIFLKGFKRLPLERRALLKYMIVLGLLYVGLYYTIGAYSGYLVSAIRFSWKTLGEFILPITITIVATEVVRAKLLCYTDKWSKVAAYIIGVLAEIVVYMAVYDTVYLDQFLLLVGLIGAAATGNLMYNFVSARYGAGSIIAYRLIITLYAYIIPVLPDVYEFFTSFCRMVWPLFVYFVINRTFTKREAKALGKKTSVAVRAFEIVSCMVMLGFIALVSCQFSVGAIVVGSGSMMGTVNKGDVVIMKEYGEGEKIHEGEVIVFERNGERIVHRVVKVSTVAGEEHYYTKGDANESEDDGYATREEVDGKVVGRVPVIGWPTLWLKEIFKT